MITAIVMISVAVDRIPEAAEQIAQLSGVQEVYSVTGDTDLIAVVKVAEHEQLADVIADGVSKVPGIVDTRTFIAFRTYSAKDLDSAYALGLD